MTSPRDTSLVEEEEEERDGVEWEEGVAKSDFRDLNCTSLRFMLV